MPHAVEFDEVDENENRLINSLINGGTDGGLDALENIHEREFEQTEKANDALDFGDIDDDDLAEDEGEPEQLTQLQSQHEDLFEGGNEDDPFDDLFGEDQASSPPPDGKVEDSFFEDTQLSPEPADAPQSDEAEDSEEDAETREQRLLFERLRREREDRLRRGDTIGEPPPAPETNAEVFSVIFPQFEAGRPPRFGELLPGKRARFVSKTPLKPPKPVQPTKVNLEIHQDQEKTFRLPEQALLSVASRRAEAEARGLVLITNPDSTWESSDEEPEFEIFDEEEEIGGVTWHDLVALCKDWDVPTGDLESLEDLEPLDDEDSSYDGLFDEDDWNSHADGPPAKKRKLTARPESIPLPSITNPSMSSFDDPEGATMKLAKKVQLDLNDPYILVEAEKPSDSLDRKRKLGGTFKRDAAGGMTKDFSRRYNISNDEAYDLLKENHQSKVRSTLSTVAIEHSFPAVKLQYPFYKVRLGPKEARSFHRPALAPQPGVLVFFDKPAFVKRKHLKGRDAQSIFHTTKDLSLGDNSNMLLLEYSEEYPTMLSGFGMGSKLINYYRRKDNEDNARPKLDVGETQVLLPQDKSPFSIFGDVDRGHTMPTLLNGMFRAPVFKHEPSHTDFIIVRNSTHVYGSNWYLRNVENLHVVGQEFPLVEVPGTHSRKVTDAAKKRLRMLAYRMFRNHGRLKNEMILEHLPGSDIAGNRSKMREFMDYDKDKGWLPRKHESLPDEADIRSLIKPEDVCLLYSMHVGDRHLSDAGYNKDDDQADGDEEDQEDGNNNLDKQLAPWATTKNFLNACQGKAMLKLHGEGDPSGRGEAFNFIRTSMKGGFKEIGESIEDRLDSIKHKKDLGGHTYNVAKQQKAYTDAIRRIWDAQSRSLSSSVEHDDVDMTDAQEQIVPSAEARGRTPTSTMGKPRRDDETGSVFSRASTGAEFGKVLRITRRYRDKYGKEETKQEIVSDARVFREYQRRRRAIELNALSLGDMKRTGDVEYDDQQKKALQAELVRLERNKDRRLGREKAKGIIPAGSPESAAASPAPDSAGPTAPKRTAAGGTQRKCANCGKAGHIKTNKRWCSVCLYMSTPFGALGSSKR